jgi:hypothetical protein
MNCELYDVSTDAKTIINIFDSTSIMGLDISTNKCLFRGETVDIDKI